MKLPNYILVVLVILLATIGTVYADTTCTFVNISNLIPSNNGNIGLPGYDVLIYQNATYTVAANITGYVVSAGLISNHTDNLQYQAAHNYLTAGGQIFVKPGTYTFGSPVNVVNPHTMFITGQKMYTHNIGPVVTITTASTTNDLFFVDADAFSIEGFQLNGGLNAIHAKPVTATRGGLDIRWNGFTGQTNNSVYLETTAAGAYSLDGGITIEYNSFLTYPSYQQTYIKFLQYKPITAVHITNNVFEPGATDHIYIDAEDSYSEFFDIAGNYGEDYTGKTFIHVKFNGDNARVYWMEGIHNNNWVDLTGDQTSTFLNVEGIKGAIDSFPIHDNTVAGRVTIVNSAAPNAMFIYGIDIYKNYFKNTNLTITGDSDGFKMRATIDSNRFSNGNLIATRTLGLTISGNTFGPTSTIAVHDYGMLTITGNKISDSGTYTVAIDGYHIPSLLVTQRDNEYYTVGWTKEGAAASISNGGAITTGLGTTPTWCIPATSVAGDSVAATSMNATTFTVAIWNSSTHAAGTTQTIYWRCGT